MTIRNVHPLLKIILSLAALFIIGLFIQFPSFPLSGDIEYIEILYRDSGESKTFEVSEPSEIKELQHAGSFAWTSLTLNAWEGNPSWILKFHGKTIYIDKNEFGSSSRPPEKLLVLLRQKYS